MEPEPEFSERGYLLPEGCKDLIDTWESKPHKKLDREAVTQRILDKYSARLADPNLSDADRAKIKKCMDVIQGYLKQLREKN